MLAEWQALVRRRLRSDGPRRKSPLLRADEHGKQYVCCGCYCCGGGHARRSHHAANEALVTVGLAATLERLGLPLAR